MSCLKIKRVRTKASGSVEAQEEARAYPMPVLLLLGGPLARLGVCGTLFASSFRSGSMNIHTPKMVGKCYAAMLR